MDYGQAFTYPQQDAEWLKKWGIAALLSFVPVLGAIMVAGYALEITRRVITENPQTLPAWDDFGEIAKKGMYAVIIGIVYNLPVFVLGLCASIPNAMSTMSLDGSDSGQAMAGMFMFVSVCCSCLIFLLSIITGIIVPAALGKVAATNDLAAGFRISEVVGLVRAQPAVYLIVMLISVVAGFASLLGVIACFVGLFATTAYVALVNAHLVGRKPIGWRWALRLPRPAYRAYFIHFKGDSAPSRLFLLTEPCDKIPAR